MKDKTFYQFQVGDERLAVVSLGDSDEARAFFLNPEEFRLEGRGVSIRPRIIHALPRSLYVGPLDDGVKRTCWTSWRVTDFVFGLGDGKNAAPSDGVVVRETSRRDVRLAVARALVLGDHDVVGVAALLSLSGVRFAGLRASLALWRLRRAGVVEHDKDGVYRALPAPFTRRHDDHLRRAAYQP